MNTCHKLASILLFFLFSISCKENKCKDIEGIVVSYILAISSKEHNYDYCSLLKSAIKGNREAVKSLSLLEFGGAVGYDHGAVLIDLIDYIGEDNYVNAIQGIDIDEKRITKSYLDVGLEYGNNAHYKHQSLKKAFPQISSSLN